MIDSQNSGIGMGTEIEGKGYGYYSMRDVNNNNNEQSSGNNWPILYGEKSLPSSSSNNGFSHKRTSVVEFDKNTLRQTMLEHEAIFKRHVAELHCLYKVQRDMMDEVRRKDFHKLHPLEPPLPPPSSTPFSAWNSQDCEILDHRPSKVRKRLFDLQFTGDQEGEECSYDVLDYPLKRGADASKGFVFLADLNEPITQGEEIESISKSEFLHRLSKETSRRDEAAAAAAIRSNGKGDWLYAEHYRNHLNSSSSQDAAIQTLGFLQSEQRRELHGRKHSSPFGVINHKTDWSQSWGKSIQNPSNPLHTNSSLYSSKPMGHTSNLCFSSPLANNHHSNGLFNGVYRGSSSGSKNALSCFPPVVGLDYMNPIDKGRKQDHHPHLPSWLKPEAEFKPKNPNSAETIFQGNSTPPPSSSSRKILGFTISNYPTTSASLQPTPIREDVKKEGINSRELIDINVAYYDPEPEPKPEENNKTRTHIDLNSCIIEEEEDPPMEPIKRNLLGPKFSMEIDLEAPPQPEEDEQEEEDNNAKIAAEAILSISVSTDCPPDEENTMEDPLGWFAEIVVRPNNNSLSMCEEIMDYFEAITLSLPEMKQEEYIPKEVIIPKDEDEEELGGMMGKKNNRNRRSRRGRQKRDFQRDILPGLVSLSRHEVSEDIQTFSGLMKATGYNWQSGLTRGRRRRVVVELGPTPPPPAAVEEVSAGQSLAEVGGGSSLTTVWGKTLRRPRRQRCPATPNLNPNPTTITITSNSIISS